MKRPIVLVAVVAVVLVAGLVVFQLVGGGEDEPEFTTSTYEQLEADAEEAGLTLCDGETSDADVIGGYEKRIYHIGSDGDCGSADDLVIVRAFNGAGELHDINSDSYTGDNVLGYRWHQYLISVTGAIQPDNLESFRMAMDEIGAEVAFDQV